MQTSFPDHFISTIHHMHRVCIVGSGNFGSTIAKIIAENIIKLPDFDHQVRMYVYDEFIDGESLIHIINTRHENVKFLPGVMLPTNVLAVGDLAKAAENCDFYVFVTPHQFLPSLLKQMIGKPAEGATGLSLIKGITMTGDHIELVTDTVESFLGIPCGALMGANIANDLAQGHFCESTIAFHQKELGERWYPLIHSRSFRIKVISDLCLQQLCGTIKNIVALGGGFVDGLQLGESTKAAILRIGLEEMFRFAQWYYPGRGCRMETLLETCGVGDVIASAYGGRNHKCAVEFVNTGKEFTVIEKELLNGQKLQGTLAAAEMYELLSTRDALRKFPLITTIHLIATKQVPVTAIIDYDGNHLC
jgi:glycerol-3-phosphate dehydrogenase (NAD+)